MTRLGALVVLAIVLPLVLGAGCLQGQTPGVTNTTSVARHALMQQQLRAMTGSIQDDLDAFDCNANGRIDFADVVWLFNNP